MLELSGEHAELPTAEAVACMNGFINKIIEKNGRMLIVDISEDKKNKLSELKRLALSHYISKFIFSCSLQELFEKAKGIDIEGETFRVKVKKLGAEINTEKIERTLGAIIAAKNKKVNLKFPDAEIRVCVADKCFVGERIVEIDRKQYEKRKSNLRPFFSPISLHPRIARAMVNLARAKEGHSLLDPFCGTGGILIEAGLTGLNIIGSDIDEKMVEGTKGNLEFFGLRKYRIFKSDIGEIARYVKKVDAVVTDPPYGRSASTKKEPVTDLYRRAFEILNKVLKKNRYLVIVVPNKEFIELGKEFFELAECYSLRVHKSLTRNICVYRNS